MSERARDERGWAKVDEDGKALKKQKGGRRWQKGARRKKEGQKRAEESRRGKEGEEVGSLFYLFDLPHLMTSGAENGAGQPTPHTSRV